MSRFQSLREYEEFAYTLPQAFQSVRRSTLIVTRRGKTVATLQGELAFEAGLRVVVKERLTCDDDGVLIRSYGYEIWQESEKIVWYDSQPHPDIPELASTHPHHKHIPPDIKHHRIPAPHISFDAPNLPKLIQEVETLIRFRKSETS